MINSLSIMFMASLISGHFQIRFKEYMEIRGELNAKAAEDQLDRLIEFIHQSLRPLETKAKAARVPRVRPQKTSLRR